MKTYSRLRTNPPQKTCLASYRHNLYELNRIANSNLDLAKLKVNNEFDERSVDTLSAEATEIPE